MWLSMRANAISVQGRLLIRMGANVNAIGEECDRESEEPRL